MRCKGKTKFPHARLKLHAEAMPIFQAQRWPYLNRQI